METPLFNVIRNAICLTGQKTLKTRVYNFTKVDYTQKELLGQWGYLPDEARNTSIWAGEIPPFCSILCGRTEISDYSI